MHITVRFFAGIRDRAGIDKTTLNIPSHSTVAIASAQIAKEFPATAAILARVAYAINQSYVPITTQLNDGDELAIIPPVSGG